ncbi:LUD domain-containing protein [Saccharopolyspora halophila]|uniref:LUD domain-containing protein n=1 Tax=Saccharopolyspora halophila TaxID=405551 RepID=A0ABN3GJU9_9PSEU
MSDAREAVLGRVRAALHSTERSSLHDVPRDYRTERPAEDLVELFREHVTDYQASVQRVSADAIPSEIADAARSAGAAKVLIPDGAPQVWCDRVRQDFELVAADAGTAELEQVDAVITTAAVGIASTGTIVLDHGPGQGRRAATLVPDVHVCVVAEHQVVDDVPAALSRLDPVRPMTFISGPSATSDIELNRVEGVHGPRTLHVLVVPDV